MKIPFTITGIPLLLRKNLKSMRVHLPARYGKFVCQPLERGFATTIGNSLRRIMLSSIRGAAITSVRLNDALHEFTTIDGVHEDVAEIILNLKQVRLKA